MYLFFLFSKTQLFLGCHVVIVVVLVVLVVVVVVVVALIFVAVHIVSCLSVVNKC